MESTFTEIRLESWWGAQDDMGTIGMLNSDSIEVKASSDGATVTVPISGSKHDAVMEILIDENYDINGITTNVSFSFGEKMGKAGLNTLMGMGTVFVVLILISLIISCFSLIPKLQEQFAGKNEKGTDEKKEAAGNAAVSQIEESEEELADDLELVAVISAAIAASEGAAGTDGFVVRSVRRVGRR